MSERLGWLHALLSRWAFAYVHLDPRSVERLRSLAARGSIVYVMRYRSVADALLINSVFARHGLPLPEFANDLPIGWFRPLRWIVARIAFRLSRLELFGRRRRALEDRELAERLVRAGRPMLVFLRSRATGPKPEATRIGDPFLSDTLRLVRREGRAAFVVPLALFRGRGYRRRGTRLATRLYSAQEAPGEAKRLLQFLFNRHDLALTLGNEIPLTEFVTKFSGDSEERLVRRLARALNVFLQREERVVWGPPLLPKWKVRRIVLGAPGMQEVVERVAAERGVPVRRVWRDARSHFDEMASNFNGIYFAVVAFVFRRIWNRIFRGVEITGLDRVADCLREHPVVLVPCHRSHFDYLILTYIFHGQFLSPPHIAAGVNLSFFPLGMLFRGAGAYFIRRRFGDDELYKGVFRHYLRFLIGEGYTQEFFIEGGRSRTGKILTPKMGMLSAIVDAFSDGIRPDLYLVPVSISYERLVEEESYREELLGGEKPRESFGALLRAGSVLRRNYGTAFVSFAEPISLAAELAAARPELDAAGDEDARNAARRRFALKLGFRLLEEVNDVSVVTAPSIAATVLLSHPHPAIRYAEFLRAAHVFLDHAAWRGASLTSSLENDRRTFRETIASLQRGGLIVRIQDPDGEILHVPDEKRISLDFYKNNSIHLFVVLSLVADGLRQGLGGPELTGHVQDWLALFRNEFVLPEQDALGSRVAALAERLSVLEGGATDHPVIRITAPVLQNFREAYWVAARRLLDLGGGGELERVLLSGMRRFYRANTLLGVLRRPEGNNVVTLRNALRRFEELGVVAVRSERREARVLPGPGFPTLRETERRLARTIPRDR